MNKQKNKHESIKNRNMFQKETRILLTLLYLVKTIFLFIFYFTLANENLIVFLYYYLNGKSATKYSVAVIVCL